MVYTKYLREANTTTTPYKSPERLSSTYVYSNAHNYHPPADLVTRPTAPITSNHHHNYHHTNEYNTILDTHPHVITGNDYHSPSNDYNLTDYKKSSSRIYYSPRKVDSMLHTNASNNTYADVTQVTAAPNEKQHSPSVFRLYRSSTTSASPSRAATSTHYTFKPPSAAPKSKYYQKINDLIDTIGNRKSRVHFDRSISFKDEQEIGGTSPIRTTASFKSSAAPLKSSMSRSTPKLNMVDVTSKNYVEIPIQKVDNFTYMLNKNLYPTNQAPPPPSSYSNPRSSSSGRPTYGASNNTPGSQAYYATTNYYGGEVGAAAFPAPLCSATNCYAGGAESRCCATTCSVSSVGGSNPTTAGGAVGGGVEQFHYSDPMERHQRKVRVRSKSPSNMNFEVLVDQYQPMGDDFGPSEVSVFFYFDFWGKNILDIWNICFV